MAARICVVGALVMDLVAKAPRFPVPGETLIGTSFATFPGGKGANQAVAAARGGAEVTMVGCVGEPYGRELLAALGEHGVATDGVVLLTDVASGIGMITVTPTGENAIVLTPGANHRLDASAVAAHADRIAAADALLLQLEVPLAANVEAARIARGADTPVILNTAPAADLHEDFLAAVDLLIANRVEAGMLAGADDVAAPEALAAALHRRGVGELVITLGDEGALHSRDGATTLQSAFPVEARDATACGDAFVGVYATAFCEGASPTDALRRACAAGALAACIDGAMPSLPDRDSVQKLLQSTLR